MNEQNHHNPWIKHAEKLVYESKWIKVFHHECTNPAGKPASYSVVHFCHLAIGIVALDEEDNIWLVGQWRYPIGQYSWEIPEGGGRLDEAPLESAKRELKEETGLVASRWKELFRMHLSNSATDELAIIFKAEGLAQEAPQPEETEVLQLKKIPLKEAYQMVKSGEITDSLSVAGIMYAWLEKHGL
jgi:8-oxo-dGTP pyrophosphatase MutT (NUDIX family)